MKKIINGKKYDTETAKKLGSWSNHCGYSDFNWCEETLYIKKTGEYFLFGEGGPMSEYAEACGQNQLCSGARIIPYTVEKAREWAEMHLDADVYESIFGEVEE